MTARRFVPSSELLPRAQQGDIAAIARLLTRAEAGDAEVRETLGRIYSLAGKAHIVGITGVPGSGKSTMVAVLARLLRKAGHKVGIIAIDPSSPYSGGSIMGDRIRMQELADDEGIYIRSMATRGATGGLARASLDTADVLDVAGYGFILIETVGVGQDEVEIASASHTTVVVSAPGLGDEIQAIKAGILEIADVHVVSKADRSDARATATDIKQMLTLGMQMGMPVGWVPPVVLTSSMANTGFEDLVKALEKHRAFLDGSTAGLERRKKIASFRMLKTAEELLRARFRKSSEGRFGPLAEELAARRTNPYQAGEELLARVAQGAA
jgi:LAO/AO transport system kinase